MKNTSGVHPVGHFSIGESSIDEKTTIPILTLQPGTFFPSKKRVDNTDPIYIRDCYIRLLEKIDLTQRVGMTTLVKGNPSIGKSIFLFFYLYQKRLDPNIKSIFFDVANAAEMYQFTYTSTREPVVYSGKGSHSKTS
ncbi:hypothetical protein DFA_10948 [Cavenderia fasciculata]|uniref:Uncharacterized protein n=1 Tax=Cavenderia fasciculata TaxID=261658 RepID=F4QBV2_CACFS|nr:uncharacterized protein DFA_10948 [Cavenderia fasciculata]EGG14690.1 hypothetical protein DFA_10948 [Cavenderia fasciculata]|eukprot:XP_004351198.1 hypothetical protein DFA_10948 [Cavenderia fasciculata]